MRIKTNYSTVFAALKMNVNKGPNHGLEGNSLRQNKRWCVCSSGGTLTDEADGLGEELREILAPVVRDGDLFVLKLPGVLEEVGQVGGHVEDVLDAVLLQHVQVGGVLGAAQVEVRQDLHGEAGQRVGERAAVRVRGAARVPVYVRLDVRGVGADAQPAEAQNMGGGRAAVEGAVQVGFAHGWILCVESTEATWKIEQTSNEHGWHCKFHAS